MKEKLKTINIKGKEYVQVNERIRYFNEAYKNGAITTKIIHREGDIIIMQATVIPEIEKPERFFTGYAQETKGKGLVNATSYIENCETSAIGRALGFLGIGVETSIASAEEVARAISQQENPELKEPKEKPKEEEIPLPPEPQEAEEEPEEGDKEHLTEIDKVAEEREDLLNRIYAVGKKKGYSKSAIDKTIEQKCKTEMEFISNEQLKDFLGKLRKAKDATKK